MNKEATDDSLRFPFADSDDHLQSDDKRVIKQKRVGKVRVFGRFCDFAVVGSSGVVLPTVGVFGIKPGLFPLLGIWLL